MTTRTSQWVTQTTPISRPVLFAVILAVAFAAQMALLLFSRYSEWAGWFPALWARSTSATVLGVPLVAAASAFVFSAPRADGMRGWMAASGSGATRVMWPMVLLSWLSCVIAYLVVCLGILIGLSFVGEWHGPTILPALAVLPVLTQLAAATGVGAILGWRLPRWAATAVAALLGFATYFLSVYLVAFTPEPLASAVETAATAWVSADWSTTLTHPITLLAQALWFGAVALIAWRAITRTITNRVPGTLAVAALSLTAVIWTAGGQIPIPGAERRVCAEEDIRTCVGASYVSALPQFAEVTGKTLAPLPQIHRPTEVLSDDLVSAAASTQATSPREADAPPQSPGVAGALVASPLDGNTQPSRTVDAEATASLVAMSFLAQRCPTATGAEADRIYAYLLLHAGVRPDGTNRVGEGSMYADETRAAAAREAEAALTSPDRGSAWLTDQLEAAQCQRVDV